MIGFYVIMIAVLALSGAVGYTILTSVQTTNALSLAERNAARLELAATALRQVVIADAEGRLFVPMGTPSDPSDPTSRTALPDWVSAEAITPWGAPYAYCPYAPVAGTGGVAGTVYGGSVSGTEYAVSLSAEPIVYGGARDYVISGSRSASLFDVGTAPEVLGFLISPSNNATEIPSCLDVYWDGRSWLTRGPITGSVRAVTLDSVTDSLATAPRLLRRHARQGATGSGLTEGDPAGLDAILSEWRYLRPHRLTIVLQDDGGPILVDPAVIDLGAGAGASAPHPDVFGRHLIFEARGGDAPLLSGSGVLSLPADATISGINFGPGLGLSAMSGSRVLVRNATLSSADTGGGELILGAGTSVTAEVGATAPPLRIAGGVLAVEGAVSVTSTESGGSAVRQSGGALRVNGALTVVTGASAPLFEAGGYGPVSVGPSGSLTLNGAATPLAPYTAPVVVTSGVGAAPACTEDALTCQVACPTGQAPLSGTCSTTGGVNTFLLGYRIDAGDNKLICSWGQASGGGVTTPDGPNGPPVASALCAAKR